MDNKGEKVKEIDLMREIKEELEKKGYLVFRANVGIFKLADGRFISTGLPKGFSDLFGYTKTGRAFFIEVKVKSKLSENQKEFLRTAVANRCLAGVAYSIADAFKIVRGRKQYKDE